MFQSKEKISTTQGVVIVIAGGLGTLFVVIPRYAITDAGRDGWMSVFIAYGLALLFGLFMVSLGQRFPNKTFIQYLPIIIGKISGKLVGLICILIWWIMTPLIVRINMALFAYMYPDTPPLALGILMSILIVYSMSIGFEVFARTAEVFIFIIIPIIILSLIASSSEMNFKYLQPVLENGFIPLLKGLPKLFPFAVETILFMGLWFPCMNRMKDGKKTVLIGIAISGVLVTLITLVLIAFGGTEFLSRLVFPTFYMSRHIFIGGFLSGFEGIFMILWMLTTYLQLHVFFYTPVVGLAQWLNLKEYKSLILPLAIINVILAFVPSNIVEVGKLDIIKNPYLILPMALLIPILWLIAVIRKLDESKKNVNQEC